VVAGGSHYLVQTKLRGQVWLRVTLQNPFTTDGDLDALLDALRAAAA
jgi:L-2,4-diaminobutyrate decarboxylase